MNKFVRLMEEEDGDFYGAGGESDAGQSSEVSEAPEIPQDDGIPHKSREEEILEAHEAQEKEKLGLGKEKSDDSAGTPAEVKPKEAAPVLDDAALERMANAMLEKMSKKTAPVEEPFKITPELVASLKPVVVTKQLIADLFPEATDAQIKAMQSFANMITEHSVRTSRFLNERLIQDAEKRFAPIVQSYEGQMAKQAQASFFEQHKDIAKYPKFVSAAAAKVNPRNADGSEKTAAEVATEVSELARAMLKEVIPDFGTDSANPDAAPAKKQGVPVMAPLSGAGRSLSGSKGAGKPNNPDAEIYD